MSTQVYEKLFLVNNIPKIEGILQVRDMIKGYAYTDDMYMIRDMKLAKKFSKKFKHVHMAIHQAYSRTNPVNCECCREYRENDIHKEHWIFGYDRYDLDEVKNCDLVDCRENVYHIEQLQLEATNCYICGEYITSSTSFSTLEFCSCVR